MIGPVLDDTVEEHINRVLELKVAHDPFTPSTERQVLTLAGVVMALLIWRLGGRGVSRN